MSQRFSMSRICTISTLVSACGIATAENMGPYPSVGPIAGETVPPLETVVDETAREVCHQNMAVD